MYTVVLMAALTTTPAVPDFGHRRRGHGCNGGGYACCGGGGGGYGCCGGGGGCCGGGGAAYGGWGDGGYYAGTPYNGNQWGGYGYGTPVMGGTYQGTTQGGYYGQPGERVPSGTMQRQGTGTGTTPGTGTGGRTGTGTGTQGGKTTPERVPGEVRGPAPAQILVNLPANARLSFDGVPTQVTSTGTRLFTSPPLDPGHEYYYTVTSQITRDGQPVTETQRVNLRAGRTSQVTFRFPTPTSTAQR